MSKRRAAIVIGVGAQEGLGAALSRRLAKEGYPSSFAVGRRPASRRRARAFRYAWRSGTTEPRRHRGRLLVPALPASYSLDPGDRFAPIGGGFLRGRQPSERSEGSIVLGNVDMEQLYLEDIEIGRVFKAGPRRLDETEIKQFAADYDPQPFHLDGEAARDTFFRGLAASGWQTAAITMRLLVESDFNPAGGVIGAGIEDIRWPRPVRPGDELRIESEVREIRPSGSQPGIGLVKAAVTTFNQDDKPVQTMLATLVVPRRSPVEEG